MQEYSKQELEEAIAAIGSLIGKCEKVFPKLKEGSAQKTLMQRRIKAFHMAHTIFSEMLENGELLLDDFLE